MPILGGGPWTGLDVRRSLDVQDRKTLRIAKNLDLTTIGTLQERDGMKPIAELDARSVGLYSINGGLRAVIPAGYGITPAQPAPGVTVIYDAVGDGTIYALGTITGVPAVSSWGADPATGVYPYIVIQRSTGKYEHHWINVTPPSVVNPSPPPAYLPATAAVDTRVDLPFEPGPAILKIQAKLHAPDNVNGVLRFSSTANGPSDWILAEDAGFLAVLQHVSGSRNMTALGPYDTQGAVFFPDAIQLWQLEADPSDMSLVRVLEGPGTTSPRSVANVRGDLFYLSRGTVNSLRRTALTGQLQDGDIGAPIAPLTRPLTATPIALWSQARSQYIIAFGTDVFCFTSSPATKVTGWTSWSLPFAVNYMVELDGILYIRSANTLYRMTAGYKDGSSWEFQPQFFDGDAPGVRKFFPSMNVSMTGEATINFLTDVRDVAVVDTGFTVEGATSPLDDIYVGETTESLAVNFTGLVGANPSVKWAIDSFTLPYKVLGR
jgi:hypothetical protein